MEILINDTNIFIDLHSIGLLQAMCDLPYEVRTVDFVMNEVRDTTQAESLARLVADGYITVESFDSDEVLEIIEEHSLAPRKSIGYGLFSMLLREETLCYPFDRRSSAPQICRDYLANNLQAAGCTRAMTDHGTFLQISGYQ